MNIRQLPVFLALILVAASSRAADKDHPGLGSLSQPLPITPVDNQWFGGLRHPLPVKPVLPANFIAVPLSPDGKFDMAKGVLWAPQKTALHFEYGADKQIGNAKEPLFYLRLSETVTQSPGTDKISAEKNGVAALTASGVKNVRSRRLRWGDYPVFVLTGEPTQGPLMYTAFVGLNSPEGWVLAITYRVPNSKGHPTDEERRIWEAFLDQTKIAK